MELLMQKGVGFNTPQTLLFAIDYFSKAFGFNPTGNDWNRSKRLAMRYKKSKPGSGSSCTALRKGNSEGAGGHCDERSLPDTSEGRSGEAQALLSGVDPIRRPVAYPAVKLGVGAPQRRHDCSCSQSQVDPGEEQSPSLDSVADGHVSGERYVALHSPGDRLGDPWLHVEGR